MRLSGVRTVNMPPLSPLSLLIMLFTNETASSTMPMLSFGSLDNV